MIRVLVSLLLILITAATWTSTSASAQDLKELGGHGKWTAYSFEDLGNTVCYMASAPTKQSGDYTKRGEPYALVTNRPATKSKGEVNFVAGYTFKDDAPVTVIINKQSFELFTTDDRAWSPDSQTDVNLVKAMVRGSSMTVEGVSSRGTKTTDTYSLSGFTATQKLIDRACPIK
jgi:hypothetical protein